MADWITETLPTQPGIYLGLNCTEAQIRVYRDNPEKIHHSQICIVKWDGHVFTFIDSDAPSLAVIGAWQFLPSRMRPTKLEKYYG